MNKRILASRYACTLLLVVVFANGCGDRRPVPESPNVLIVTFDTLRADYLGCYGRKSAITPNVDRLAQQGVLFEQCTSPVPITLPSHASILTGLYPPNHGVRNNGSYTLLPEKTTLAEILYRTGYETAAFVSARVLAADYGTNQGFEVYDDQVEETTAEIVMEIAERDAQAVADNTITWLRAKHERPYFLWVHFFDPHMSYDPPSKWKLQFPTDNYAGEIAFADEQLGRVLEYVDLDNTLLIFTSDHGESLGEHGELTHAFFAYDSTLQVPLVFRFPDGANAGQRRCKQTSLVDVFPTVLSYLGIGGSAASDGIDLFNSVKSPPENRWVYLECVNTLSFGWSPLAGIRSAAWKFINAPKPELFDLETDPREGHNVFEDYPQVVAEYKRYLDTMEPLETLRDEESKKDLTAEEREILASLGYVGNTRVTAVSGFFNLPDPKDMLEDYLQFLYAQRDFTGEQYQEAIDSLQELLERQPQITRGWFTLGRALTQMGHYDRAVTTFEQAKELNADDVSFWYALATAYNRAQMPDKAIGLCGQGIEMFPDEAGLFDQLGLACKMQNDLRKAIEYGRKAIELDPEKAEYFNNLGAAFSAAGDFRKAVKNLEKALEIRSDFSEASYNLGVVFLRGKDYPSAERCLRDATRADPENYEAWVQLNKAILYQSRSDDALSISEHLLEMQPEQFEVHYFMSVAYRQKKDYSSAEVSLKEFLKHNDGFGPGYLELAEVFAAQGKLREARDACQKARARGANIPAELQNQINGK